MVSENRSAPKKRSLDKCNEKITYKRSLPVGSFSGEEEISIGSERVDGVGGLVGPTSDSSLKRKQSQSKIKRQPSSLTKFVNLPCTVVHCICSARGEDGPGTVSYNHSTY